MNKQYYGLVSGLKTLLAGKDSQLDLVSFREWLSVQLEPKDFYQVVLLFYKYDNTNLLYQMANEEKHLEKGNLPEEEVKRLFKSGQSDDVYMASLLEKVDLQDDKLSAYHSEKTFTQHYFDFIQSEGIPFLKDWAEFEITFKNLTTVYALRNLNWELNNPYIKGGYFTGLELKRINSADLDVQYPLLKQKFDALEIKDPVARKLRVDEIKWQFLDEHTFFKTFGIERILAYVLKLMDLEVWKSINPDEGAKKLNAYVNEINEELETLIQ